MKRLLKVFLLINAFSLFFLNVLVKANIIEIKSTTLTNVNSLVDCGGGMHYVTKKCDDPVPSIVCTVGGDEDCNIYKHCK